MTADSAAGIAPAIGEKELRNKLLDICWIVHDTRPGGRNAVKHPVCHIKPVLQEC